MVTVDGCSYFSICWRNASHQGDRIRTYGPLYPKQMRWPDCATPRLTTPEHIDPPDRWTLKPNSPILLGTGTREPKKQLFFWICLQQDRATQKSHIVQERSHFLAYSCTFISKSGSLPAFGPLARLEVDSNHWHKDFQSFALTSWATWTTFLKYVLFIE